MKSQKHPSQRDALEHEAKWQDLGTPFAVKVL